MAQQQWLHHIKQGKWEIYPYAREQHVENVLYIGKVPHKDKVYDGQHQAIISRELFDEVQKSKARTASADLRRPVLLNMLCLKGLFIAIVVRRR